MNDTDTDTDTGNNALCERIPFWIESETAPTFCWLHIPNDHNIFSAGVVVCSPLGYEYSHTHRSIRHLCDNLAAAGYPTIRFDYHGTGDSFSNLQAPKRINAFMQNIEAVIDKLKSTTGVSTISLIGLRLGASLAAAYSESNLIDNLALWSPCIKGRAYVREMKALEKLASHAADNTHDFIDSGGFIVTNETAETLSDINLLKQKYLVKNSVLVIERDDFKLNQKLIDAIKMSNIKNIEQYAMPGYTEMMAEPHLTEIPLAAISRIQNWLNDFYEDLPKALLTNFELNQFEKKTNYPIDDFEEEIYSLTASKLIGILSRPSNDKSKDTIKPLVILANSGSVHRVGPNRVYVELSRALSSAGYPTLRFDLRQLGDSIVGLPKNENNPYSHDATNDINDVIATMKERFDFNQFIISGLCSGAHNTFHAGLNLLGEHALKEVILINPLTFYKDIDATNNKKSLPSFQVEQDAEQYKQSLFSAKKWKKLVSGNVDMKYLVQFLLQKSTKVISEKVGRLGETLGVYQGKQLSIDLMKYKKSNIKITFFIASKDPGKQILMSESKKTVKSMLTSDNLTIYDVPNADHTFSSFACRREFVQLYVRHIQQNY